MGGFYERIITKPRKINKFIKVYLRSNNRAILYYPGRKTESFANKRWKNDD